MTSYQIIGAAIFYLAFGFASWKLITLLPDDDDPLARMEAGETLGRNEREAFWVAKLLYLLFWPLFLFIRVLNMMFGR